MNTFYNETSVKQLSRQSDYCVGYHSRLYHRHINESNW